MLPKIPRIGFFVYPHNEEFSAIGIANSEYEDSTTVLVLSYGRGFPTKKGYTNVGLIRESVTQMWSKLEQCLEEI